MGSLPRRASGRTGRFQLFRTSQLAMSLPLPFALQWSLGGFENSSTVALWAFTAPLGALMFAGARQSLVWFVWFVALIGLSAALDRALASGAPDIPNGVVVAFFALNIIGVSITVFALLQYFVRERERALAESERLLLNVLPAPVAARLKRGRRRHRGHIRRGDRPVRRHRRLHPAGGATPGRATSWRCSTRSLRGWTRWHSVMGSRRSRRSATPTWWSAASRGPAGPRGGDR